MNKLYNKKILNFWETQGENCLFPDTPESVREAKFSRKFFRKMVNNESVVEVGCGNGRIAQAFTQHQYIGLDINPTVIKDAKETFPDYKFLIYSPFDSIPVADWVIAHTVLLHVSDDDIEKFMDVLTLDASNVIISEIMLRTFRGDDNENAIPPVFNRDINEYHKMMQNRDFMLVDMEIFYFERYNTNINYLVFTKKK